MRVGQATGVPLIDESGRVDLAPARRAMSGKTPGISFDIRCQPHRPREATGPPAPAQASTALWKITSVASRRFACGCKRVAAIRPAARGFAAAAMLSAARSWRALRLLRPDQFQAMRPAMDRPCRAVEVELARQSMRGSAAGINTSALTAQRYRSRACRKGRAS